jgi:hypothetical protein
MQDGNRSKYSHYLALVVMKLQRQGAADKETAAGLNGSKNHKPVGGGGLALQFVRCTKSKMVAGRPRHALRPSFC